MVPVIASFLIKLTIDIVKSIDFATEIYFKRVEGPPTAPLYKPRLGGENLSRINAISSALSALFAALYAIGVITLAPISFMPFQVRIADCFMPTAILFGWPAIIGLTLGCLVANFFGGLGYIDVIGGSFANMVAGFIAWKIGLRRFQGSWFVATIVENLTVTAIVGFYLWFILAIPDAMVNGIVVPGLVVSWVGVFMGSLVAINVLGYALLRILSRSSVIGLLRSHGLRVYTE
jgi:uncharacterized membrane protein